MNIKTLIEEAFDARLFSYSPYSNFMVGAALLGKNGALFTGCNIEGATFSPTNCAERTAFFKAISEGVREFEAICIVGGPRGSETFEYCFPCGVCRQVMSEFCDKDFKVIVAKTTDDYKVYSLGEILPFSFGKEML
ncbi:MAG: cytidine deaminase [Oscillospiraceae bacterium]